MLRFAFFALLLPTPQDDGIPWIPDGWKLSSLGKVSKPRSVCALPDGRVLAGQADGKIVCLHPDGSRTEFASGLGPVLGLAAMEDRVFVLNGERLSSPSDPQIYVIPEKHRPAFRLAGVGPDGFLYISGKGVIRVRPDGTDPEPCFADEAARGGIAAPDGGFIVAEPDRARIVIRRGAETRELIGGIPGEFRPVALAAAPHGFLAADAAGERILRFTAPGPETPRPADSVEALAHPDLLVRLAAQRRLTDRKALEGVLSSGTPVAKAHALWALDAIGERKAILAALGDPAVASQAARALGARRAEEAIPQLLALLPDPEAEAALGHIGRAKPETWPAILKGLERPAMRASILRVADEAALLKVATDPALADEVRAAAISGIRRPSGDLLRDPRPAVRAAAIDAGVAPGDALKDLFASETGVEVRKAILRSNFPGAGERAAEILKDRANQPTLFGEAARAAGRAGGKEATAALRQVLRFEKTAEMLLPAIEAAAHLDEPPVSLLERHLRHEDPVVVLATVRAFARIGGPEAVGALRPLAEEAPLEIRKAVIAALGSLRDQRTHPHLFRAYLKPETRREAIAALAQEPDLRALDLYVEGLVAGDPDCGRAIVFFGTKSLEALERRAEANALSPATLAAVQRLFAGARPVLRWLVLVPLPKANDDPFDITMNDGGMNEGVFTAHYPGVGGREVSWRSIESDDDGYVDLTAESIPAAAAYAYASWHSPSDRTVVLRAGAEGPLTVWVNGRKAHERATGRPGRDEDRIEAKFQTGMNYLMVKALPGEGGWSFSLRAPEKGRFLERRVSKRDPAELRAFALANPGDAARGAKLFATGCMRCHTAGGGGGDGGPTLAGIGALRTRNELAESLLEPAKSVPEKYAVTRVLMRQGHFKEGTVKDDGLDQLTLSDIEGSDVRIITPDIDRRVREAGSLMPSVLNSGMSPQDFADLLGYLESLKSR